MRKSLFILVLILITSFLLGCSPKSPVAQLVETSRETISYEDTIRMNNCGGKADSEQLIERSFRTSIEGGMELGAGYKEVFEGRVSAKYGQYKSESKSMKLVAPPGTNMEFLISWSEEIRAGNVTIDGRSGNYNVRIPLSVEQLSGNDLGCDGTSQNENIHPTITPQSASVSSTATTQPETNLISVWGVEENGVRIDINESGMYKISYQGDAYSPWPNEQHADYQGWTTILRIYINNSIEWGTTDYGLVGPINHDYYLGPGGYYFDKNEAISSTGNDSRTIRLDEGDYITLVILDEKGRYFDNRGKVDVGITYLGSN
jgi:hypothetical protein